MSKMNQHQLPGKTKKRLLNMAVGQVHFKCIQTWYVQKDSLAIGASPAVFFANRRLKQYETALLRDIPKSLCTKKILKKFVPRARRRSCTGQKEWNVKAV